MAEACSLFLPLLLGIFSSEVQLLRTLAVSGTLLRAPQCSGGTWASGQRFL